MMAFSEKEHTYLHIIRRKYYGSVSGVITQFKPKFDEAYWAIYTAIRVIKKMTKEEFSRYMIREHKLNFGAPKFVQVLYAIAEKEGILQEVLLRTPDVKDEWHTIKTVACEKGTAFHIHKENEAYEAGFMSTHPKDYRNVVTKIEDTKPVQVQSKATGYFSTPTVTPVSTPMNFKTTTRKPDSLEGMIQECLNKGMKVSCKDLYLLPDGYYPELIIWNDKFEVCGTADKVWINTIQGVRFIDIDDWKTNKEIKMPNRYCMEKPLQHLSDVNYIHYTLQLSTYAWMLEQAGFTIRNIYLTHQRSVDEEPTRYKLKYLKKEVVLMMTHKK